MDKPINPTHSTKNGIVTLFGVASDAALFSPTSIIVTNQYYLVNNGPDGSVISQETLETKIR